MVAVRLILPCSHLELGARRFPCCVGALAVDVHLQDVDVVGEAVQQRAGVPRAAQEKRI